MLLTFIAQKLPSVLRNSTLCGYCSKSSRQAALGQLYSGEAHSSCPPLLHFSRLIPDEYVDSSVALKDLDFTDTQEKIRVDIDI